MSEQTKIECHIDPFATGRTMGAYKSAAAKIGCTIAEWMAQRSAGMKWCFRCRIWKPSAEFSIDRGRKGGQSCSCKECTSDASTASRYGMSIAELRAFRETHEHRCGICAASGTLYVDHNHQTGQIRGLLCPGCNSAIGVFREDPSLFAAALAYLEKHNGR